LLFHLLQDDAGFKNPIFSGKGIYSVIFLCYRCNAFGAQTMIFLCAHWHVVNKHGRALVAVGDLNEELIVLSFTDNFYGSVVSAGNTLAGMHGIFNGIG